MLPLRTPETPLQLKWVWVYGCLVGGIVLISFTRAYLFYMAALK